MGGGSRPPGVGLGRERTSCVSGQVSLKVPPVQDLSCSGEFVLKGMFLTLADGYPQRALKQEEEVRGADLKVLTGLGHVVRVDRV